MENNEVIGNRSNLILMPNWSPGTLAGQEPFDIIFLHGGVTEIPTSIMALTKPEARIAALLKGESGSSLLIIIRRNGSGEGITVHGDMFFPVISAWNSENR
jgi:protein-L-isoaspartate O-methyltransferase